MALQTLTRIFMLAIAVMSLTSAATLIGITTYLHRVTARLAMNLEGVRAAQEVQLHLLWYDRFAHLAAAPATRDFAADSERREAQVREWYERTTRYIGSDEEREIITRLAETTDRYFAEDADRRARGVSRRARHTGLATLLDDVHEEAERLVHINLEQAASEVADAERWDSVANWLGLVTALLLVLTAAVVVVGVRMKVLRPLLVLRQAIGRYARRDYATRVPECGPPEICDIGDAFNEMATTIDRQRRNQLSFIAGVAHDLRTPLSAMKVALAALRPSDGSLSAERQAAMLSMLERQVNVLVVMISDLLDAAQVESGQVTLATAPCDLRDIVRESVRLFHPSSSRHEMTLQVPDEPLCLPCDAVRIERAVNNLVSNAIKYSPDGGRIEVATGAQAGSVFIRVRDEGIGIAAEEQERIFEPFRRGDRKHEAIPGVGLGLSVARRIVRQHGGDLTLHSAPGQGSTFTIRLPVAAGGALLSPSAR